MLSTNTYATISVKNSNNSHAKINNVFKHVNKLCNANHQYKIDITATKTIEYKHIFFRLWKNTAQTTQCCQQQILPKQNYNSIHVTTE